MARGVLERRRPAQRFCKCRRLNLRMDNDLPGVVRERIFEGSSQSFGESLRGCQVLWIADWPLPATPPLQKDWKPLGRLTRPKGTCKEFIPFHTGTIRFR